MDGIAVYDIESNNWNEFEMLGFYDGQTYALFDSVKDFLHHIDSKQYHGFRLYAHNAGRFDLLFLLEELLDSWDVVKIIERSGSVIYVKAHGHNATLTFADSYALLPSSLRSLGESFKVQHPKLDSPDFEAGVSIHSRKDKRYLQNDCLCLYEVLEKACDFLGELKFTIASQAMETFTRDFDFDVQEFSTAYDSDIRKWYYGGRVEVFKSYGEHLRYYDVNSLYPYAMKQGVPYGVPVPVAKRSKNGIGFYTIMVTKDVDRYISPLPYRYNKSLYFAQGAGIYNVGSLTLDILDSERVRYKVLSGFEFSGIKNIFDAYVDKFFYLKQTHKGDAIGALAKLLLNALYGKFGMRRMRDEIVPYSDRLQNERYFMEGFALVERESHSRYIFPAVAAWITEQARVYHYQLMKRHENNLYYCDTDSILTTADYPHGTELGALKQEGIYKGIFLAPKFYALKQGKEERVVFKGYGSGDFSFTDFRNALVHGKELSGKREKLLSFRECIKVNDMLKHGRKSKRKGGVKRDRGKFLKVVDFERTAKLESKKRLTFASEKFIFDSVPFTQEQIHNLKGLSDE